MNKIRNWVPILGLLALVALFFKLPETPAVFSFLNCKSCASSDPYLPLLGAGYFSLLIAISLLFPSFPGPKVSRGGLTWAVLLALALTYVDLPGWCYDCLIAHACNILIWAIWFAAPSREVSSTSTLRERLCLTVFAPVSVVALFSCLNLTFMAYGLKVDQSFAVTSLRSGDTIPTFSATTNTGRSLTNADIGRQTRVVLNFIAPDCPYCKQELPVVEALATKLHGKAFRFVNVSSALPGQLTKRSPTSEWVADENGKLRQLFHVTGYPTIFVVKSDGKIADVVSGVPDKLKDTLLAGLGSVN